MTSDHLNELLNHYTPEVRELTQLMREVILKTVPAVREKVYLGWRNVGYSAAGGMRDQICAIGPMPDRINLYFTRGADLPDPAHLLEGTGKKMRHVKLYTASQIRSRALKALIKSAAALVQSER